MKTGQAKTERYDDRVTVEEPELLRATVRWLAGRDQIALHRLLADLGMAPGLYSRLTGEPVPALPENVVPIGNPQLS